MPKKTLSEIRSIVAEIKSRFGGKAIELDYGTAFQLLVAVMLSAQTTDRQVNRITPAFFSRFREARDLRNVSIEELEGYFRSVNYFRNKSRFIKLSAEKLDREFSGIIPNDLATLITFPGVGVKTAKVVLAVLYGEAYVWVDTHVHRVLNRLGIVSAKTPESTDRKVAGLPEDIRRDMHHPFVLFGRYHCKAVKPLCPECFVREHCEYAKKTAKKGG